MDKSIVSPFFDSRCMLYSIVSDHDILFSTIPYPLFPSITIGMAVACIFYLCHILLCL